MNQSATRYISFNILQLFLYIKKNMFNKSYVIFAFSEKSFMGPPQPLADRHRCLIHIADETDKK